MAVAAVPEIAATPARPSGASRRRDFRAAASVLPMDPAAWWWAGWMPGTLACNTPPTRQRRAKDRGAGRQRALGKATIAEAAPAPPPREEKASAAARSAEAPVTAAAAAAAMAAATAAATAPSSMSGVRGDSLQAPSVTAAHSTEVTAATVGAADAGVAALVAPCTSCPSGHPLRRYLATLPSMCCGPCGRERPVGSALFGCSRCDFDVCGSCRAGKKRAKKLAPVPKTEPAAAEVEVPAHCFLGSLDGSEEGYVDWTLLIAPPSSASQAAPASPLGEAASTSSASTRTGCGTSASASVVGESSCGSSAGGASTGGSPRGEEARALTLPPSAPAKQQLSAEAEEWMPAVKQPSLYGESWHPEFTSEPWPPVFAEWAPCQSEAEAAAEAAAADLLCSLHLLGDESLQGPDGDIYEVFYPSAGLPEEPAAVAQLAPELPAPTPEYTGCGAASGSRSPRVTATASRSPPLAPRRNSAEFGIGDIVTYMRSVQAARYPARARLFEVVRSAAASSLGDHFSRLALVGSAALRIDTPDSDLDAVVFTRLPCNDAGDVTAAPLAPAEALRRIAHVLASNEYTLGSGFGEGPLRFQLVDCARVPVLTVLAPLPTGDLLSLDLTVDQPLGEWHVLWFLSQRSEPEPEPAPLHRVPAPRPDGWEQGLESAALRCVKWWLRRRKIPVSKEGGYPTVAWTLMVVHVLRCSLFVDDAGRRERFAGTAVGERGYDEHALLGALAAFFDRFSGGPAGTLLFAGTEAQFWPQPALGQAPIAEDLSVLDPTTTQDEGFLQGMEPADLAPRISPATRLLQAYELRRAAWLSAVALRSQGSLEGNCGGAALQALFSDVGEFTNLVPTAVPEEPIAVVALLEDTLHIGYLTKVQPKFGWSAPFLHRSDCKSRMAMKLCEVDPQTGLIVRYGRSSPLRWFTPADFVCALRVKTCPKGSRRHGQLCDVLEAEELERWLDLHATLAGVEPPTDFPSALQLAACALPAPSSF
eukprot:TRINITY_DN14958_c0_g2_i4.p1 TRINITY_DN14958_c0_g2~~TRINITY_DN14958_c0_g2_i4.p1  ORF type:complete len:988 (-),score=208.62 TRINITY_DN14958_c0_g2_i4:376-3339(-)